MKDESIRVAIVDDHPALREGTAGLLALEPDLDVVGVVGSLAEASELMADANPPHVLVLDIRLGGERGLDLLGTPGTAGRPRPAIVVWTAYDVPQYAAFAFRSGAAGFVVKTAPTSELIDAIRHAAAGRIHFTSRPDLGGRPLSGRERQILEFLAVPASDPHLAVERRVLPRPSGSQVSRSGGRHIAW
jgi:DNA-binding NarL/FixJ family response regulator